MAITERHKLIIAGVIAAAGAFVAIRAFHRSGPHEVRTAEQEITAAVQEAVVSVEFDTKPTKETMPAILEQAHASALAQSKEIALEADLPTEAARDLADAFRERLAMTLDGDFDRNRALLRRRGDQRTDEEAEKGRESWDRQAERLRYRPISLENVEARLIYVEGDPVGRNELRRGFSTLTCEYKDERFGVPLNGEDGELTVAEVRLPMENTGPRSREGLKTLVGYQFAWSDELRMWIPWKIVLYNNPNEIHFGIFF